MKSSIKNIFIRIINKSGETQEFNHHNYEQLYERIKLVSYMLILTYPCFFLVDFVWFKDFDSTTFKIVLATVHLTGLFISLLFIILYRRNFTQAAKGFLVNSYVFLYLLIGAASSINSQLFTKNIYAYIIILLAVAAIFPIRPRNLFLHYFTVQAFFLAGLSLIASNHYSYLSMVINSTGTVVIAFTIALAFYSLREGDFLTKGKLSRSEASFRSLFNLNPKPLILMRLEDEEIMLMNHQASQYYHLEPPDMQSHLDSSFLFRSPSERLEILSRVKEEKSIKNFVTQQHLTFGLTKWSLLNFERVDYLGHTCMLIDTTDITDMKQKEAELFNHASMDMLTGVRNRRSGIELLRKLLSEGAAHPQGFILCYVDVNNLKIVNDRFGHSAGDDLIQTCCATICDHLDAEDVLFRLGGDEFVIIFFKKQLEDIQRLWGEIQLAFQNIHETAQKPYEISASYGLYHYMPGTPVTLEEMLEKADQEMYKEKYLYKHKNQLISQT